jgi:ornithine--oxo-acid transaminase
VFTPGSHGSTFGGNPLACAVGREVVAMLRTGEIQARVAALSPVLDRGLRSLRGVAAIRCRGLWAGVDLADGMPPARVICEALVERGVLVKDTHGRTFRIAPPLVVDEDDLRWGLDQIALALGRKAAL